LAEKEEARGRAKKSIGFEKRPVLRNPFKGTGNRLPWKSKIISIHPNPYAQCSILFQKINIP